MVMPPGNEDDIVAFDRQFCSIHECESFSADDIKELVGLSMNVHTRGCACGHGVPEHLDTLRSGSRTCLDEGLSFTRQTIAVARFQHSATLLRPRRAGGDETDTEQHEDATVDQVAPFF